MCVCVCVCVLVCFVEYIEDTETKALPGLSRNFHFQSFSLFTLTPLNLQRSRRQHQRDCIRRIQEHGWIEEIHINVSLRALSLSLSLAHTNIFSQNILTFSSFLLFFIFSHRNMNPNEITMIESGAFVGLSYLTTL